MLLHKKMYLLEPKGGGGGGRSLGQKFRDTEALCTYKARVKIMHPFTGGEDLRLKLVVEESPTNYQNLAL
jgi:hypothetical protein